nr:isoleucine--tRNA ligase [Puniceicoccus vermicola]
MRAGLVKREPERIQHWKKIDLYGRMQESNAASEEEFLLHDGPPFTNGDVHIGTALNKILKDTIVRFQSMKGRRSPYIPGWDCHGLPIEHKVARQMKDEGRELTPVEMRKACEEFSKSFIEKQRGQFERLGVQADWEHEYRTMNPNYEAAILRTFAEFVANDLVYRSKKPVYWSIPCQTALAEAEIEYQEHTSPSIYVAFPLGEAESVVIWTTTPWTLPANLAVAVHPRLRYAKVVSGGHAYWIAETRVEEVAEKCALTDYSIEETIDGAEFAGREARHPFIDRPSPIIAAEYVTATTGTGCVHTAPGHGIDDYVSGLQNGLEIYCPLDDNGCYVDDGRVPADLVGLSVLEKKGKSPANSAVLEILKEKGVLLAKEPYVHSYPHCWRSKTPVVFRAMDQWFVSLDKGGLRERALEAIGSVKWEPTWGENRIRGAVESRPDWCISRQRTWGVPIPAFFNEDGEAFIDPAVIRGLADKVESEGCSLWFQHSASELLEGIDLPEGWSPEALRPGTDTLDVWIDSGCSHRAVLKQRDMSWPADLYIEGSDQHRGWFQSSLWTGMIADGQPPYKKILTHGFVVGQDGRKISKSDGKPQTADSFVQEFGADIVRLWISSEDYRNDIPVSGEILKNVSQTYRNVRNTLRFQIGNLYDFDPKTNTVADEDLDPLDQWALARLAELIETVDDAYECFAFHRVYQEISRFCAQTLSASYHDILKDRLYTLAPNDARRRSSQTVLFRICDSLCRILNPILSFTADESYAYLHDGQEYGGKPVQLAGWPEAPSAFLHSAAAVDVDKILRWKAENVNDALEEKRKQKEIASSLDAKVKISGDAGSDEFKLLESYREWLPEFFIVSAVELEAGEGSLTVEASHADGVRCPRTWRWVPSLVQTDEWGEVSERCAEALRKTKQTA